MLYSRKICSFSLSQVCSLDYHRDSIVLTFACSLCTQNKSLGHVHNCKPMTLSESIN